MFDGDGLGDFPGTSRAVLNIATPPFLPAVMISMVDFDRGDWSLDPSLFDHLNLALGPFTLDVFASHLNAHLPKYFTKEDSAFDHSCSQERMFVNAPVRLSGKALAHVNLAHEDSPADTESTHLTSLASPRPSWWGLVEGYYLVALIPKGADLFKSPARAVGEHSVPGGNFSPSTIDRGPTPFVVVAFHRPSEPPRPLPASLQGAIQLTGNWSSDLIAIKEVLGIDLTELIYMTTEFSKSRFGTRNLIVLPISQKSENPAKMIAKKKGSRARVRIFVYTPGPNGYLVLLCGLKGRRCWPSCAGSDDIDALTSAEAWLLQKLGLKVPQVQLLGPDHFLPCTHFISTAAPVSAEQKAKMSDTPSIADNTAWVPLARFCELIRGELRQLADPSRADSFLKFAETIRGPPKVLPAFTDVETCHAFAAQIASTLLAIDDEDNVEDDPPVSQLFHVSATLAHDGMSGDALTVQALVDGGACLDLVNEDTAYRLCPDRSHWNPLLRPLGARGALEGQRTAVTHYLTVQLVLGDLQPDGTTSRYTVSRKFYVVPSPIPVILGKPFLGHIHKHHSVVDWNLNMMAFIYKGEGEKVETCFSAEISSSPLNQEGAVSTLELCRVGYSVRNGVYPCLPTPTLASIAPRSPFEDPSRPRDCPDPPVDISGALSNLFPAAPVVRTPGHDPPALACPHSPPEPWELATWAELSSAASGSPEDATLAFVRFGRESGASISDVSIASLADLSPEERSYLQEVLPRRDDLEDESTDLSVKAELSPSQQNRLDEILLQNAPSFTKETHFDDSADRTFNAEMPIRLTDETAVTTRRGARRLTPQDFEELKKQVAILLKAGMIEYSDSAFGAPILFVAKKGGKRRFAVDFRQLNDLTIKQVTPLPRVDDMLQNLQGAKFFSKLDATWMFWQLRLRPEDAHKTGMVTPLGHFHWKVVPFGLTNAPGHCMNVMSKVLDPYLYKFVQVLIDDVIIYSKTIDEHLIHLSLVFDKLSRNKIFLQPFKCEFILTHMHYLGHVVSADAIAPETEKLRAMAAFPEPTDATAVRSFLGLTGYYRKFIRDYSSVAAPLTDLTKGAIHRQLVLNSDQRAAFVQLKDLMVNAPVLALVDPQRAFVLQCDASSYALGAVLMQPGDSGDLHPVGYFSRKLNDAQQKYTVTARELLAIVESFKHWRYDLIGAQAGPVTVHCDHRPLSYMRSVEPLSDMHARWQGVIEEIPFTIVHKPGTSMGPADALSRRADHADGETQGAVLKGKTIALPDDIDSIPSNLQVGEKCFYKDLPKINMNRDLQIDLIWGEIEQYRGNSEILAITSLAYLFPVTTRGRGGIGKIVPTREVAATDEQDSLEKEVQATLERNTSFLSRLRSAVATDGLSTLSEAALRSGATLVVKEGIQYRIERGLARIVVPPDLRDEIISMHHDGPEAGHLGNPKTYERLSRSFCWYGMGKDVRRYCQECPVCQRMKRTTVQPLGDPMPFFAPHKRWEFVTCDELSGLPKTPRGNEAIWIFVDKLTKRLVTVALPKNTTSEDLAQVFLDRVVQHHGLPRVLVSDRDPRIASQVWRTVMKLWAVVTNTSTARSPQTDGQSESAVEAITQLLRTCVSHNGEDWDLMLPACTFAYNDSISAATGFTPFQLDTGGNPSTPASMMVRDLTLEVSPLARETTAAAFVDQVNKNVVRARIVLEKARLVMLRRMQNECQLTQLRVGEFVLLNWKAAGVTGEHLGKLRPQWYGPFQITAVRHHSSYDLQLPSTMRVVNPINIRYLKRFVSSTRDDVEPVRTADARVVKVCDFRIRVDHENWHQLELKVVSNPVAALFGMWITVDVVINGGGFEALMAFMESVPGLGHVSNNLVGRSISDADFSEGEFRGIVSAFDPVDPAHQYECHYSDGDSRWMSYGDLKPKLVRHMIPAVKKLK